MDLPTHDPLLEDNSITGDDLRSGFMDLLKTGITAEAENGANILPEEVGATAGVKLLYEARSSYCSCCKVWDDEKPVDHDDAGLRELSEKERSRWAILKKQTRHGRGTWKTDSIEINSPLIREKLKGVFSDYPDIDPYAVPKPRNRSKPFETIHDTGFVAFADLKLLYISGEVVLQSRGSVASAGILRDVQLVKREGVSYYSFSVDVVDWNGEKFGVKKEGWSVFGYKGSLRLSGLEVLPLRAHEESEMVKNRLIARGRLFELLCGQHLRSYSGKVAITQTSPNYYLPPTTSYVPISERIIIDAGSYYALQGQVPHDLRALGELAQRSEPVKYDGHVYQDHEAAQMMGLAPLPPPPVTKSTQPLSNGELSAAISAVRAPPRQDGSGALDTKQSLSDDECLLAVAWVKGFALHSKFWCKFEISAIKEIEWNSSALQNLVLGEDEKRMLTAMIASQTLQQNAEFDDFIDGKGKGIIILLSGPPGVGKTLTAESVAEHLKLPLYRLGAADLGSTIATVEDRLSEVLLRCAVWNAVLLIDEADVFLEARTTDSLERNELISVFLRLLEYYTGILLLTTNRKSVMDRAFESRIDIALNYEQLDASSRAQILSNFLAKLPTDSVDISPLEVEELAARPWNGRQIKSAVKTARILAASEGAKLRTEHLRVVLKLREKAMTRVQK